MAQFDPHEGGDAAHDDYATLVVPPPPSYASLTTPLLPSFPAFPSTFNPAFDHGMAALGMPSGFFLLRNKATRQRTFDVRGRATAQGSEICLHPVKQPHIPRGSGNSQDCLMNSYNNQVLYLDWSGHLMSASAEGKAIDCVDGDLVLSIPRPIFAIPSRNSHPLPQFKLDPETATLHVIFSYDPAFPGPDSHSHEWSHFDYIVEAVPTKRKTEEASVWATASSGLLSGIEKLGFFGRASTTTPHQTPVPPSSAMFRRPSDEDSPPPPPKPLAPWDTIKSPNTRTVFEDRGGPPLAPSLQPSTSYAPYRPSSSNAPLPALPVPVPAPIPSLQPRPLSYSSTSSPLPHPSSSVSLDPSYDSGSDSDSDPDAYRPLRVIRLTPSWREKFPRELLARPLPHASAMGVERSRAKELRRWARRQWEVVPVVVKPVENQGGGQPILPLLPRTGLLSGSWSERAGGGRGKGVVPRPLELGGRRGERESVTSPPLPRVPNKEGEEDEGEDEDEENEEGMRESYGARTPATGDSWADATILQNSIIDRIAINSAPQSHAEDRRPTFPAPPSPSVSPVPPTDLTTLPSVPTLTTSALSPTSTTGPTSESDAAPPPPETPAAEVDERGPVGPGSPSPETSETLSDAIPVLPSITSPPSPPSTAGPTSESEAAPPPSTPAAAVDERGPVVPASPSPEALSTVSEDVPVLPSIPASIISPPSPASATGPTSDSPTAEVVAPAAEGVAPKTGVEGEAGELEDAVTEVDEPKRVPMLA